MSLLHLLAPREIAGQVGAGHRAAVGEAADYLQRGALGVRRSRGGQVTRLPTTGLVAGEFLHRTSRALDPHLHTHLVVANIAQGVDGRWSAVDGRRVFAHARATQGIYHARLRMELSGRLGAAWEVPHSGMGDVLGVDPKLRRLFSQRLAAIEEYVARGGGSPTGRHRSRGAFHATRPDKDRTRTFESLMQEWKGRASDFGFDLGDLTRVVGLGRGRGKIGEIEPDRVIRRLDELPAYRRTLAHRDVVAMVAGASPSGSPARVIESVATRIVECAGAPLSRDDVAGCSLSANGPVERGRGPFELRWTTTDVVRAVGRGAEELVNAATERTWSASGVGRSAEPAWGEGQRDRSLMRTAEVDRARTGLELRR